MGSVSSGGWIVIATPERYITVGGVEYPVRRLTVRDTFSVARIMAVALGKSGDLANGDLSPQRAGMVFFAAIPYAEDEAMRLLASLIGVTAPELAEMPPEVLPEIIGIVADGQDLRAFLASCSRVAKMEGIAGALPKL